ncbi:MAG: dNTP triphosphohydrolase [Planctomycetes bacterium]|nr:dNTP triphosphohydrolase [Planctomycetota bacterium]
MSTRREHDDPHLGDLPPLVLDRQRVVHSPAFRRLQCKTQVFVTADGDHFRTRLTHTLEVADLARCIAAALGLSSELAEVVALAHDVGHPPFGHAGELALNDCLREQGGFEHNAHALRVVEELEHPYPEFRGLNLTHVVRECLAKHTTRFDRPGAHPLQDGQPPPLEGQVADIADRLTYGLHDLQDGLYAGMISQDSLTELALWNEAAGDPVVSGTRPWRRYLRPTIDAMRQLLVSAVVTETRRRMAAPDATGGMGERSVPAACVALPPQTEEQYAALEDLLTTHVYRDQRVARMDAKAQHVVKTVFAAYLDQPQEMGQRFAARVAQQGVQRVAGDYLAGMTDRFCLREHTRLFDPRIGTPPADPRGE